MKDQKQLVEECFKLFIEAHPELSQTYGPEINRIIAGEKATYAKVAIRWAVSFMADEAVLKESGKK